MTNERKRRMRIEVQKQVEEMVVQRRQRKAEEMQRQLKLLEEDRQAQEHR